MIRKRRPPSTLSPSSLPAPRGTSFRFQCRLRCRQTRDGHPVGRGADIIETGLFAEMDARRIAAMLAADAELDVGARFAPAFGREVDQLPDAFDVKADERVGQEDALVDILRRSEEHTSELQSLMRIS